jgi:hypothetical protein
MKKGRAPYKVRLGDLPVRGTLRRVRVGPVAVAVQGVRNLSPDSYRRAWGAQLEWWGFLKGGK